MGESLETQFSRGLFLKDASGHMESRTIAGDRRGLVEIGQHTINSRILELISPICFTDSFALCGTRSADSRALQHANARYSDRASLKTFSILARTKVFNKENLYRLYPTLVVLGFVDNEAYTGRLCPRGNVIFVKL